MRLYISQYTKKSRSNPHSLSELHQFFPAVFPSHPSIEVGVEMSSAVEFIDDIPQCLIDNNISRY